MRAPRFPSTRPVPADPPRGGLASRLAVLALLAVPVDDLHPARDALPATADSLESWLVQADPPRPAAADSPEAGAAAKPRPEWRLAPFVAAGAIGGLAGTPLPLFIQVAAPLPQPDAAQEPETYVLISRVPPGASLSKGADQGDGAWRIPLDALTDLTLTVPAGFTGTATLTVTAVSDHGGDVVARQSKELAVPVFAPLPDPAPAVRADTGAPGPVMAAVPAAPAPPAPLPGEVPPDGPPPAAAAPPPPLPRATEVPEPAPAPPREPAVAATPLPVPTPPPPAALPRPPVVTAAVPRPPAAPAVPESTLMARGDALFAQGDLAGARLFYEMAAAGGSDPAALALGKSYDPVILARMRVRGLRPDPDKAAEWYGRAAANGNAEAEARLKELAAWLTANPRPR